MQGWASFVFPIVQMEKLRPLKGTDSPSELAAEPGPPVLFMDLSRGGQEVRMVVWSPDSANSGSLEWVG